MTRLLGKTTLVITFILLILTSCGEIEQEVKIYDDGTMMLETCAWSGGVLDLELVSYQLVYTELEFESFSSNHLYIWCTRSAMSDSIKAAQYEFAKEKLDAFE